MKIIKGNSIRPRLSVFRSHREIYAQIIDDDKGKTLVAASERDLEKKVKQGNSRETKTQRAEKVGEILARKALSKKITTVVFDRRRYKYHGRVKALAEGARKGGLQF